MSRSEDASVLWDISRLLVLAAGLAFVAALFFGTRSHENPGVQDCGTTLGAMVRNETDATVPIPEDDPEAAQRVTDLRAQTPCSERVGESLVHTGIATAAGIVLGLAGVVLGLVEDRRRMRAAPRFEDLVRTTGTRARPSPPAGAGASSAGTAASTGPEDVLRRLPPVRQGDVLRLTLASLAGVVVIMALAGPRAVTSAVGSLSLAAVFASVVLAALVGLGATAQRIPFRLPGGWAERARDIAVAVHQGRPRPAVGVAGAAAHEHLLRGAAMERAVGTERKAILGDAAAAALVLAVGVLAVLAGARPGSEGEALTTALLGLGVAVAVVVGATGVGRRLRALPVVPDSRSLSDLLGPERGPALVLAGGSLLRICAAAGVVTVLASAAGGGSVGYLGVLVAVAFGYVATVLAPTPGGSGLVPAVMVLALGLQGAALAPAAVAVFGYRLLTFWAPMVVGLVARQVDRQT